MCFTQHSISEWTFLDLAWIIPQAAMSPSDIPITIVFAEHISLGDKIEMYLTSLIPGGFKGSHWDLI